MKTISLNHGKVALVDDGDYEWLSKYKWQAVNPNQGKFEIRGSVNGKSVYMHRLILGFPDSTVDHINNDSLDNQRSNLRLATIAQNNQNRKANRDSKSGFKGVWFVRTPHARPWEAQIQFEGWRYQLGYFETPEEAATSYGLHALAAYGEFANF